MTAKSQTRTITLTDRPPVRVSEATWPIIASARRGDGAVECQDNHRWHLTVRQHAAVPVDGDTYEPHEDGRIIVYGSETSGPGGVYDGYEEARAGEIVEKGCDIAAVIRRVGQRARCSEAMIDECIADLPAVDLDEVPSVTMHGISSEALARLLALLTVAMPHCPADLQGEIRAAIAAGAS